MGEDTDSWRETLYIWDGIVSLHTTENQEPTKKRKDDDGDDDKKKSTTAAAGVSTRYQGTWIATKAADAVNAPAPKRNAFAEFVDSDVRFDVQGLAAPYVDDEKEATTQGKGEGLLPPPFLVQLIAGPGWDMDDGSNKKIQKYRDTVHDVLVKSLRWSGNMYDQTENLIVAKGNNAFGPFVSVGWMRPGNRWTLARRYLPADDDGTTTTDPRTKWSLSHLLDVVVDQAVTTMEDTGQRKLNIPPWQCAALHVTYQEPTSADGGGGGGDDVDDNDDDGAHVTKVDEKRGGKRKSEEVANVSQKEIKQ